MYHTLEFASNYTIDLEISRAARLERLAIRKGTRMQAMIRPSVLESQHGPIEVADLYFENGALARFVPYAWFTLVE